MNWQQWTLIVIQILSGMAGFLYAVDGRPATKPMGAIGGLIYLLFLAGIIYLHVMSGTYTLHP